MDKKDLSFLSNREYKLKGKLPQENEIKITNKKELAIQHFKSKYNCKWKENDSAITLKNNDKDIIYVIKQEYTQEYNLEVWGVQWIKIDFIEDLLSILHLYYMKKGE